MLHASETWQCIQILVVKPEVKKTFESSRNRWDDIRMDLKQTRYEGCAGFK
jgi:hypothetical protein